MTALPTLVATAVIIGSAIGAGPGPAARSSSGTLSDGIPGSTPAQDGAWPLAPEPEVVDTFAPPEERWGSGHRGVDLAGRVGQVVRSTLPGVVTYAGRVAGRGVVVVAHGPVRTTYEPVTATVGVGEEVERAGTLGTLELFGSHCLPLACLHWGAREGERYLDPLQLVGGGPRPVRLLPAG